MSLPGTVTTASFSSEDFHPKPDCAIRSSTQLEGEETREFDQFVGRRVRKKEVEREYVLPGAGPSPW
jgi:hypothetical protein